MTALPAIADLTDSATTEAEAKAYFTDVRGYLAGLFGTDGTAATALDTLGALMGAGVSAKSSAYTVAAGDRGVLLNCTGTWTLTLLAAATAGAGFAFAVRNSGTGTITLDGNAAETVDGATTFALPAGSSAIVVCTGSAWLTVGYSDVPFGVVELATGAAVYRKVDTESSVVGNSAYPAGRDYGSEESLIAGTGIGPAFRIEHYGTVTASFDLKRDNGGTAYGRVVKNGTAVQEWTSTSTTYATKTVDVPVAPGDIVEFQRRISGGDFDKVLTRNHRLYITQLVNS